jgi:HAE1 family hydrophobic/amphiphilic exporter-1
MAFLIVITLGVVGLRRLPVDLLPQIDFPRLSVNVSYANVGPQEMETIITDPLENALAGIPNLERMTSWSQEGRSRVSLEFGRGTHLDEAANDVRAALDQLRDNLPPEADPPSIWKFDPDAQEIVALSVSSTRDLASTTRLLEREIAQRFEQIPGVGSITIGGGVYRQIEIQLLRDRLRASGLAVSDVTAAVARENLQLPGGSVRTGLSELYVRTRGEYRTLDEIGATVIAVREGGPVRLRDIAEVVDGYEDVNNLAEVNGTPIVRLDIQKQSGANTVAVAARIRQEVDAINADRDDVTIGIESDQSVFIRESIDNVRSSALWGGLLAILVLYVFLRNTSTTGVIALSIPISMTATFGLLYFSGLTLNQMTFGGLALGIGLIVDNAIVVLENIVRHRQGGANLMESARIGTREVAGAVVASTLTTCVIFLPVVFMRTTSGQLFQTLALVVVFALLCSLLVALTLVPVLASRFLTIRPRDEDSSTDRVGWMTRLTDVYTRLLHQSLAHPVGVLAGAALLVGGALLLTPLLRVELTPELDTNEIEVELEMARGTSLGVARAYLDELKSVLERGMPDGEVESIATQIRSDGDARMEIRLVEAAKRTIEPSRLADELRARAKGRIPGAQVRIDAQSGLWMLRRLFSAGGGTDAVEVQLLGYDLDRARALTAELHRRMSSVDGVVEVNVEEWQGRPEQSLLLERERIYDLGLSVEEVARTVETGISGRRAGYFRESGEQFPITVRLRPDDRLTSRDLESMSVRTPPPDNAMVPVSLLVSREQDRSPTRIDHIDGQRVTYITADLESGVALGDAVDRIRAAFEGVQLPTGFSIVFGGAYREQQESQRDFTIAIILAMALVYMVMAGQFERFLDPLVVMFSVPAALIGVIPTLLLTGTTINVQSIMGMVMLVGIVVNNAIVLVDYMNLKRREDGMSPAEAAVVAGRTRLRPILMTTSTTILGLLPLAIGWGEGGGLQAALARVVVGGLLASTLVTLFLIPTLYISATASSERASTAIRRRLGASPSLRPRRS